MNKTLIALIGLGKIGQLYRTYLSEMGYEILTLDHSEKIDRDFESVEQIPGAFIERIAAWIVAVPTSDHLDVVRAILRREPLAKILIEKPICLPRQLNEMRALVDTHPLAQIAVNDVYAFSPVVRRLAELISGYGAEVESVKIELSKNRDRDEKLGRFTDPEFGDWGYEGFHLFSIRDSLIDGLNQLPSDIRLFTSVRGAIGFPDTHAARLYQTSEASRLLEAGYIPFGSEFRYRIVDIKFADGAYASLAFEPFYGLGGFDYKNTHLLEFSHPGKFFYRELVSVNQLKVSFEEQLKRLIAGKLQLDSRTWGRHREIAEKSRTDQGLIESSEKVQYA